MSWRQASIIAVVCIVGLTDTRAKSQELLTSPKVTIFNATGHSYTKPPAIPSSPDEVASIDSAMNEAASTYGLDELLSLASDNNPTLRQSRLHISAELGKALQAGLYPNPTLSYSGEQIFLDVEGDKDSPGEFQGGVLEQRFVTAGKLRLSRQKYMRRAHVAEHQAMVQRFRVCNDVRIHFYRTLAASQSLAIQRELVKTAEDSAVTAQESYNMGQARRPEVRRANITLQRARLAVMKAENAHREAFRSLTALVGIPLTEGMVVGELLTQCDPLSFDEALGRLLAESPEIAAARAKLSVDNATIQRESVEWVPDVVVSGGTGYNFDAKETTAVAGISLEIPFYDRNQGTMRQARADYARQRQEIQRVELQLRNRLATVYQQYVTALQHVYEYERVILPESKAAYAELLGSYKENRVDWPDVLMAQHDYFDARLLQVDNLLMAREHEVLIHGYLLYDGLMAAEGVGPPGHIDAVPKPR
ncbi:TolC family protein [Adhaeretor mobilis]|uniref:Cobalt-zinc-cadmium resistance protein CzcC n=1 Tax=Adhaeretor mobilis TaxID=1930276 RepID=A0A517MWJ7_9BACT|nr:TolC family protein [Adhaeretor mobilis]QDS99248.1 Cobalt-zinc-cadmium resistance protein CzcC precursor [Adhaeretor mobilis]